MLCSLTLNTIRINLKLQHYETIEKLLVEYAILSCNAVKNQLSSPSNDIQVSKLLK